ncbi:MAG TPA: hypothetical protein VKA53_00975 [Thermoanaerobaculia bacterium]|nr:hypothetical protein [Thermoanaerobaculia bacterium]
MKRGSSSFQGVALVFLLGTLLVGSTAFAQAGPSTDRSAADGSFQAQNHLAAAVQQRLMQRQLDFMMAPIKSRDALMRYMQNHPNSPLSALSAGARQRFVDSLVFTPRGLGGYYYADLEAELSASQIYRILSLFGAQASTPLLQNARVDNATDALILSMPSGITSTSGDFTSIGDGDYKDYRCIARATCETDDTYICMHSC